MGEDFTERGAVVDLARERPFRLGSLDIRPATREVVAADGREVLEPRVMQVLVALARAGGEVVTRDDLTASCWDGRIVGEDAINRVLSRLRRLSEGLAQDSWSLETITKVGYRLTIAGENSAFQPSPAPTTSDIPALDPTPDPTAKPPRRALLAAGVAALVAAAAGAVWIVRRRGADSEPPADVAALIAQAELALRQANTVDDATAIGLLRQVTERRPEFAQGWGMLASTYAYTSHLSPAKQAPGLVARARETAARALAIDPHQADALMARALCLPRRGHWLQVERACRAVLARNPDKYLALFVLAASLGFVGRCRDGAAMLDRAARISPPTPGLLYTHIVFLWAAGRLEDADRAAQRAMEISPRHFAVWFSKLYLLLYTGRGQQALGMLEDVDNRPAAIGEEEFDDLRTTITAIISREPTAVAAAIRLCLEQAPQGTGHAENSMQFACALGDVDAAFAVADAYYFSRGFVVADIRFALQQARFTRKEDRVTSILFLPSTAPMRADRRFQPLVEELGLERYWRESRSVPDYRT